MEPDVLYTLPGEYRCDGLLLPHKIYEKDIRRIPELDLTGDVVVTSYPKTGTVWTKHIVWLILNDADIARADTIPLTTRGRFMEMWAHDVSRPGIDIIKEQPHPRVIHTHLPTRFLAKQIEGSTKFVIVLRNPKDALVSYYRFYQSNTLLGNFSGTWGEFFELVKNKHLAYGDYFDWYTDWLQHKNRPNCIFICYEDLQKDLEAVVRKLAEFIGKTLSDEAINKIVQSAKFDSMKKNDKQSTLMKTSFFRKGTVGGWKDYFSDEQSDFINHKYQEIFANFLVPGSDRPWPLDG